jgi:transposase
MPEPKNQKLNRRRRGSQDGRPTGFDQPRYTRWNVVERCTNALEGFRAVATRYDERAYVFPGTVTSPVIPLWLRC